MTIAQKLAALALEAASNPPLEELLPALFTDLVAATGEVEHPMDVIDKVFFDSTPSSSAYRLACRMHARTQDDFYPIGRIHVGTTVIPACLAVGAPDFLGAMAAGYRVSKVVAFAYSELAQKKGYRPTGVFGPLGAAAAAGVGIGLNEEELAAAITLASASTAGTNQSWIDGSDEWLLEVGAASRAGVEAATLIQKGAVGARHGIEGKAGWAHAFFDDENAERMDTLLDGDGANGLSRVAIKPYPVSGIAQVPTSLAAKLGTKLAHQSVDKMQIRMSPSVLSYPGTSNTGPFKSFSDSLMSVSRCCALAYLHGAISFRLLSASPDLDEESLLKRIELVPSPFDEEASEVAVEVDGVEQAESGDTSGLLFPSLDQLLGDLDDIAKRFEADAHAVKGIADVVRSADITCGGIRTALGESD